MGPPDVRRTLRLEPCKPKILSADQTSAGNVESAVNAMSRRMLIEEHHFEFLSDDSGVL